MRKYAKTKDNKIVKVDVENGIYTSKYELVGEPKNTIEELCDEFVCNNSLLKPTFMKKNDEGYPSETYHQGIMNSFKNGVNYKNYTWYGAIWTDKGLIYVAKMNSKGELELL